MELLIVLIVFVATVVMVVSLGSLIGYRRGQVKERLSGIREMSVESAPEDILSLPFSQRVIVPFLNGIGHFLGRIAPHEIQTRMEKRIIYAGRPWNLNFYSLIALQALLGGAFLLLALFLTRLMLLSGGMANLITVILTFVGLFIPLGLINSKGEARQKSIQRALPDMLDLLLVSVEAGLGFDMALKKVTQQMVGPLSQEVRRALDEIRMGDTRERALRGIAQRSGVRDLSSFVSAVVQAEELGSNIANTLRVQSDYMRQKRRQRAQEMAMKAPVKLVFPLLLFILPALFVVIMGPAVINIARMFLSL